MHFIANILWFFFGGIVLGLGWFMTGLLWCCTIVGIPWGMQCFKFAKLMFAPFGKDVVYGGGLGSFLLNLVWLLISGLPLALCSMISGLLLCVTVIGIPAGLQCFKYAKLALMPFGSQIN